MPIVPTHPAPDPYSRDLNEGLKDGETHKPGRTNGECAGCGAAILSPGWVLSAKAGVGVQPELKWLGLRRYSSYGTAYANSDIYVCENCEVEVRPRST